MIDLPSSDVPSESGTAWSGGAEPDPLDRDDPQGALRSALAGELDPTIAPEDIVLGWLLRLPAALDPAGAAARVIVAGSAPARNERLLALLMEVARWPRHRLVPLRSIRRRRPDQDIVPV